MKIHPVTSAVKALSLSTSYVTEEGTYYLDTSVEIISTPSNTYVTYDSLSRIASAYTNADPISIIRAANEQGASIELNALGIPVRSMAYALQLLKGQSEGFMPASARECVDALCHAWSQVNDSIFSMQQFEAQRAAAKQLRTFAANKVQSRKYLTAANI